MAMPLLLLVLNVEDSFFSHKQSRFKTTIISPQSCAVATSHQFVVVCRIANFEQVFSGDSTQQKYFHVSYTIFSTQTKIVSHHLIFYRVIFL